MLKDVNLCRLWLLKSCYLACSVLKALHELLPKVCMIPTMNTVTDLVGKPLHLLTSWSHTPSLIMQKLDFSNFFRSLHTSFWVAQSLVHHLNASHWQFESQSALTFSKFVFQVYVTKIVLCSWCDFAMSSGERDSLNFGFPCLLCYVSVCCNISASATTGQN